MLSISVAISENNIIGGNNTLLWKIPEDLSRFKEITMNHTIIMGRKTFESLKKVLPGRHHIILTRDINYNVDSEDVTVINNPDEIFDKYTDSEEEAFIIGGGELYNIALPHCQKIYLTKVKQYFENGDTYFPKIDYNQWEITYSSGEKVNSTDGLAFEFLTLERKETDNVLV